jgi:hypothetical protein
VLVGHLLELKDHRDIVDLIFMLKSLLENPMSPDELPAATLSDVSEL